MQCKGGVESTSAMGVAMWCSRVGLECRLAKRRGTQFSRGRGNTSQDSGARRKEAVIHSVASRLAAGLHMCVQPTAAECLWGCSNR
jgi:hypothetical protein